MTRGAISKARHDARHDAQLALHGILNQQWLSCRIAASRNVYDLSTFHSMRY
jgi:hypothetical protein